MKIGYAVHTMHRGNAGAIFIIRAHTIEMNMKSELYAHKFDPHSNPPPVLPSSPYPCNYLCAHLWW